tara:strand:- start:162 stop:464 length:303 start_codon:yes stop_codon:yes gene_type:complete
MYVSELIPGMLIKLDEGFSYYIQESKKSNLPRLRVAPDVIMRLMPSDTNLVENGPVMYLGESKNKSCNKNSRSKIRTVMVDGQVAFIEGREFGKFTPFFD